jgi:hypothetical protein
MKRLINNDDFKVLFMEEFLEIGLKEQVYNQSLDEKETIDQLKARQIFRNFIEHMLDYDKINQMEKGE